MHNYLLITKSLCPDTTAPENPYLVTQMVSMDGGGSARDTPTRLKIPIPTTKVVEIHNCWLARAALARQPFFPRDIWSQFTALTHQQRAYTGGTGPDAYKPIDTRSRLQMPPQYVIVPLIQQLEEQLEGHPSRAITCTVKHEGVHVHVVYQTNNINDNITLADIKIYTKNDNGFIEWCTQNIARNEGIIACCEDFRQPFHTFKLKLKYWVYYNLQPHRELTYDYCSFNSNTVLEDTSFLETHASVLTKPDIKVMNISTQPHLIYTPAQATDYIHSSRQLEHNPMVEQFWPSC